MWLMRGFEFDQFVDLSRHFNLNRQDGLLPRAFSPAARPPVARIRLLDAGKIARSAASSKFIDTNNLRVFIRPRFAVVAKPPEKPAMPAATLPPRRTLSLKLAATVVPMPQPETQTAAEPRKITGGTLKLKTKVDLPPPVSLSRVSTTNDLASAFRAEMKALTEKSPASPAEAEAPASEPKRRGMLRKGWAELLAQSQEPPARLRNFDLQAAFKAEMKALLARQEAEATATAAPAPQQPATGPTVSHEGNVVPFPSKYDRFSTATKRRILGFNRTSGF